MTMTKWLLVAGLALLFFLSGCLRQDRGGDRVNEQTGVFRERR